jgi:TadE-like protein
MTSQRGQSTIEFAVGASALLLLMFGIITLAAYQDVQRRTAFMARQAAFHGAWVGVRQNAESRRAALHTQYLQDPALSDATGGQLLVGNNELSLETYSVAPPGLAHSLQDVMLAPLQVTSGFLGSAFDLTSMGFRQGSVEARVLPIAHLPQPFDALDLRLSQPFGLLTDAWHSGAPSQVVSRTGGLVPTRPLARFGQLWQPLQSVLSVVEPSLAQLCLGIIESDRVPEDRLSQGVTPLPGRCP